ncbi:glycosyltransferase family 4 protein [Gammaproteobacteria bacterium]|nr:glycosyltransferase family 4 protein [Gammaproteobacteria bacterium]
MILIKTIVLFTTDAFALINFRGNLIRELVSKSYAVHVIAPNFDAESRKVLCGYGASTHDCHFERTGKNVLKDLKSCFHLLKLLKVLKPDCMLSFFIKPVIYGTACAFFAGVGHRVAMIEGLGSVFSDQGSASSIKSLTRRFIVSKMYKCSLMLANAVVFLNQDDIDEFNDRGILKKSRATLLGGIGVDLNVWVNNAPVESPVTFIMVARLLREKGVVDFADAARRVKYLYPDTRFIILGGLDLNPDSLTFQEVNSWVVEGIVEWPGHVSVMEWLAKSSVFVLPSYYREGVPRSSQEAAAMGLPIITTDSVGCRETVIDGVNGFLVPIKNFEALSDRMIEFIRNPRLISKMGKYSRQLAEQEFSEEKKIAILLNILKC